MIKLKSSKSFIGELIEDLNITTADYIDSIFRWIETALGQMGMASYYSLKTTIIPIKDNQGKLPCDFEYFHSLWRGGCPCNGGLGYININNSPFIGNALVNSVASGNRANVEGRFISTDIKEGNLLLVYRAIPKDEEGYPMIPDNAFLKEALLFYIIYRLILKGISHPTISLGDALNRWETLYPRASNDIDWFSLPELEEFTRLWSSVMLEPPITKLYSN